LVRIRINVKYKENFALIEKEKTGNIPMVKYVFLKRKMQTG